MAKKGLGVGLQNIKGFSEENRIYVDKTEKIYELMQLGVHNFVVRPRRFGKSLLLDTVAAIYEGKKEQFVGTWAYDNIDWETIKRPTIRIDFTLIESEGMTLEQGLINYLRPLARKIGIDTTDLGAKGMFRQIIEVLGQEKGVVILIDEYEMAVTDLVGKDEELLEKNIFTLKKFYGTMKGAGNYIHRSYITGVSKIGKIGILSDLNMLNDVTLDPRFATLFGYTETELRHYYGEYIAEAAQKFKMSEIAILGHIKNYYNGYSWDGIDENRVYNPFSIVNFCQSLSFENYWFETGTPTVLVRGARKQQITLEDLENLKTDADLLKSANLKEFYSIALLFQSGYLTIKKAELKELNAVFTLGFPNREVRESFSAYFLAEYVGKNWEETKYTIAFKLKRHLQDQELAEALKIFAPVIASTGYDIVKNTEGYFHTIMHVLMYSTGLVTVSELQGLQGRLDTICLTDKAAYIFEFKINETATAAIRQIKKNQYADPFLLSNKAVYIIGVNFVTKDKKINAIIVEKWENNAFKRLEGMYKAD
ncbi:MAG: AAA family ATPase [Saprospiraceae bacterium]|nr:AAA family ATPase [Saprospiraceae bacterium]